MKKLNTLLFLSASIMTMPLTSCVHYPGVPSPFKGHTFNTIQKQFNEEHSSVNSNYVKSLNKFAGDFFKNIQDKDNKIFSPLSIAACFSMLLDGAANNSKKELEDMLHYDDTFNHLDEIQNMHKATSISINDEKDENLAAYLDVNESIFVDESFKEQVLQSYIDTLTNYYFAEGYHGTLQSKEMHDLLAKWLNDKTNHFFNLKGEDFEQLSGVLWLVNAIYLNAQWDLNFYEYQGKDVTFNNLDKSTSNVKYITHDPEYGDLFDGGQYMITSIPLKGGIKYNVLLPKDNSDYEKVINDENSYRDLLDPEHSLSNKKFTQISYKIPQYKNVCKYDLVDVLPELGVKDIFNPQTSDLSRISNNAKEDGLYVESAVHCAGIDLSVNGIEAAAYTIIEVAKYGIPEDPVEFNMDRPFIYTITDQNNLPLFMGNVTNL